MVLHLESGYCPWRIDEEDIKDLALQCHQSKYYAADYDYYDYYDDAMAFMCPSCDAQFFKLSSLFQHAESDCCEETVTPGTPLMKLLRFLQSRIG